MTEKNISTFAQRIQYNQFQNYEFGFHDFFEQKRGQCVLFFSAIVIVLLQCLWYVTNFNGNQDRKKKQAIITLGLTAKNHVTLLSHKSV